MNALLLFNLKTALSLSALAIFYKLFLSGNTLFKLNRYFLLSGMIVSVVISGISLNKDVAVKVIKSSKTVFEISTQLDKYTTEASRFVAVDFYDIIFIVWLAGFLFQLFRCTAQIASFQKMRLQAAVKKIGDLSVYVVPQNVTPFSFGQSIFIPQSCIDSPELDQILTHEKIHVGEWHTADTLLAELCCSFVWYTPLVFQLKKYIRYNLEFLVDSEMLRKGVDKQAYQYLLLRYSSRHTVSIGNGLNNSFLKNRIKMINQKPTRSFKRAVYVFYVPLIVCLSFSFGFIPAQNDASFRHQPFSHDTTYRQKVDHIEIYGETGKGDTAYIHYKNGSVDKVFLRNREDHISFHRKYSSVLPEHQMIEESQNTAYEPFTTIPETISEFTMNDEFIWLTLRDGTKEKYKLSDQKQRSAFERKYGMRIIKRKNEEPGG